MAWDPEIYNQFKAERYAPFYDLLPLIQVIPELKAIDLGCGTGELTGLLADYLPGAVITGIDSSAEMLKRAAQFSNGKIHFERKSIEEQIKQGTKWDLIFSNAALQWIDHHERLFPDIISLIHKGGQLAVQVPSNQDHFTHTALLELASQDPFKEALGGWIRNSAVLTIGAYAGILFQQGGSAMTVYEKVYPHILKNADSLYDWVSGTAMIPYIEKLPEELKNPFKNNYRKKLSEEYRGSPVFYPFKRIIMKATF